MILGGCLGLGLWYREQFVGRIRAMRVLASVLEMFMSEIRYGKATFPESCRHLAERLDEPYSSCLSRVSEEAERGRIPSFQEIFCGEMEICMRKLPLKREDCDIFLGPFRGQGFRDGEMQLKSLEQGLMQLEESIRTQEREQREKCRMAVGLGAMSGLLLLIVLL
ncbi:MAG: stage III sporulation protein AB [Clostridium sp.]|nr:stage III sporulation protein AB [Acetatifactor muris]MCM1527030.1 stage III sporulation protein AB [Bacteroides sp.]MCM1562006.1 stage III sporulation protein AB [Clostridium sp.]